MTDTVWRRMYLWAVAVAVLAVFPPHALAQAPSSGSVGVVEGRVTEATTREALPGAKLTIPGSAIETSTDRQGTFRLTGVPAGQHTILISYLGAASPIDIAPTLAFLSGVTLPRPDGRVLTEALSSDTHPAHTTSAR
jgi:carboxypeptidase-like protein